MTKKKNKLLAGVHYVWNRPAILVPIMLIPAYFLFNWIRVEALENIFKCNYVLRDFFLGGAICTLGGGPINSVLGKARDITVWTILVFFSFLSILLTQIINKFKVIVRLVTLDREEWKRFGSTLVTFLLIFVVSCTLFYFKVAP